VRFQTLISLEESAGLDASETSTFWPKDVQHGRVEHDPFAEFVAFVMLKVICKVKGLNLEQISPSLGILLQGPDLGLVLGADHVDSLLLSIPGLLHRERVVFDCDMVAEIASDLTV
jgi:hypothetical protein